jgi:hypothetical protein
LRRLGRENLKFPRDSEFEDVSRDKAGTEPGERGMVTGTGKGKRRGSIPDIFADGIVLLSGITAKQPTSTSNKPNNNQQPNSYHNNVSDNPKNTENPKNHNHGRKSSILDRLRLPNGDPLVRLYITTLKFVNMHADYFIQTLNNSNGVDDVSNFKFCVLNTNPKEALVPAGNKLKTKRVSPYTKPVTFSSTNLVERSPPLGPQLKTSKPKSKAKAQIKHHVNTNDSTSHLNSDSSTSNNNNNINQTSEMLADQHEMDIDIPLLTISIINDKAIDDSADGSEIRKPVLLTSNSKTKFQNQIKAQSSTITHPSRHQHDDSNSAKMDKHEARSPISYPSIEPIRRRSIHAIPAYANPPTSDIPISQSKASSSSSLNSRGLSTAPSKSSTISSPMEITPSPISSSSLFGPQVFQRFPDHIIYLLFIILETKVGTEITFCLCSWALNS